MSSIKGELKEHFKEFVSQTLKLPRFFIYEVPRDMIEFTQHILSKENAEKKVDTTSAPKNNL